MNLNSLNINSLSYLEVSKLIEILNKRKNELHPSYAAEKNRRYREGVLKREIRQKEFDEKILPKIKKYLVDNLVKDVSIIKVKGARDGKGIRKFLEWSQDGNSLECRQIIIRNCFDFNLKKNFYKREMGQITQHFIDKVTHIEINGKFVKILDLI